MPIPKANKAKQRTAEGIASNLEFEALTRQLAEEAKRRHEEARQAREREKQQEINRSKIRSAQIARQRNLYLKRAIQAAGEGAFFIPISLDYPEVKDELTGLGFRVSTCARALENLGDGDLAKVWTNLKGGEKSLDLSKVLEPLRKFLMIAIVKAWRSRDNDIEHIRKIVLTLLREYYVDLELENYWQLWERVKHLSNLHYSDGDRGIVMSDLFESRADYSIAKEILGKSIMDIEIQATILPEFFQIVQTLSDTLRPVVFREEIEEQLAQEASSVINQVTEQLSEVSPDDYLLSWWASHCSESSLPTSLSHQSYWLASAMGQTYLDYIARTINSSANSGLSSSEITIRHSSCEFASKEIIQRYLKSNGYEVNTSEDMDNQVVLTIAWT